MGKQGSSQAATTCELPSAGTPSDGETELLRPFLLHLQREKSIPPLLLHPLLSDIAATHEETAALALRSLGYILHHENIVAAFSDESASAVLHSLLELITSTERKALCSLAVWCLGIQEFGVPLLETQIYFILRAIVHAIDNPMGSKAITYEALQAVVKMVHKVPKMRSAAAVWAPPVYKRLLSADKRDRDMAERCLKDVESSLLPPLSSLSKVVAMDINQTLLSIMEKVVKLRALVVPTIRAWSWLVRLLGSQAGENRVLVNQMLKVAEVTFTSHDSQVQIASLVAWEALIDALFQYLVVPELQGSGLQPETDTVSPSSGDFHKSRAIPSVKRLKLLMMPLITIMSGESHESVRLACWHTWTYLSHKLEFGINSLPVQAVVVTPMFEAVFKSGPERGTPGVWDLCLNALEALIACKVQNKLDSCSYQAFSIGLEGRASSPKTPTMCKSTKNEAQSTLVIKWAPWSLESLESILRLVRVLWKCGVENYKKSSSDNLSLNGALRMLFLVIKGVEGDGKGSVKPSMQHVKSVHSLLRFVREISWERELTSGFKEIVSVVWPAVEVLMELGSLVLSSSFYKLCFLHQDVHQNQDHFCDSLSTLDISNQKEADCMPISSGDLVTPIVYMIVIWISLGCTVLCEDGEEEKVLERLEKLAESTKAGLGAMDNLRGVGHVLDWFFSAVLCRQETIGVDENLPVCDIKTKAGTTMTKLQSWKKGFYFLRVWKIFAYHMTSYLESSNDVPAVESGISDSGYQVVHKFLLLPVQFCLHVTNLPSDYIGNVPEAYSSSKDAESVKLSQGADELELVVAAWTRLFNCSSRISSLKSSRPNYFASAHCQKILKLLETYWHHVHHNEVEHAAIESCFLSEMLGVIIINVLRQAEVSSLAMLAVNRKKRLGSFIGGTCLSNGQVGNIVEDTSNVRDILCLTSRILDLSWNELAAGKTWWFDSASRVLAALASFVARLYSQQDALMFLQDFSKPFSKWLSSSESSFIKQNTSSVKVLMQALKNLWEKLLSCLERCQPPLIFDSNLLSLQAPLLIPAFQHSQTSISNSTLSFWEATYGSKASFLNYPSCLVPVLHQLKDKVKISLPGWDKHSDKVSKGRPHSEIPSEIVLGTPTGGRRQLRVLQEQGLERKKGSICRMASTGPRSKHDEICTSMNVHTSNLLVSVKSKHTDKPVDALLERIKKPVDNAHSIAVSTGVAQAGLDTSKDRASVSKDALTLMTSTPSTEQSKHKPASGLADKIKADAHLFDKNIVRKRSEQSAKVKRKGEGVACRSSKAVQIIEGIPKKLAPNTAASIKPGEQFILPCHDELAINDKDLLQVARNNDVTGSEWDSGASSRRKKLRFLDDECLEYASIPLTQKMAGPLTDHQKEVRLAQCGAIGSACTSHGAGIKTYTSMDFSQSQVVLDSEDPEEVALQMNNQFVRGDEKLQDVYSSLMLSESHTKQTPQPLVNKDAHSDMVGRENMIVSSSEKGRSDLGDATPPELKPPYHHKSLLDEKVLQKNGDRKNPCGVDSAEHKAIHRKRSAEAGNEPHLQSGVQWLKPVTPSKILRSGKKLARKCETDNGVGEESKIAVSSSGTCPATAFCEIQLVNPLVSPLRRHEVEGAGIIDTEVPAQVLVASGFSYQKGHKEPQNVQEDTRSRLNVLGWGDCKASDKGSTSPRCAQGATQPRSDGHNCREYEVLEGDTQPVIADTQPCDTSDINRFMAAVGSDDKRCSQVTNALVQHSESNEDLTGQIGTKWAICDLLTALSSSSQWNSMDLESLECAQKLLSVLQGQVLKSKGRLIASRSV